jgi:hypothetical protein
VTNHLAVELRQLVDQLDNTPPELIYSGFRGRLVDLAFRVEQLGHQLDALEVAAAGLDQEQEIRARALEAAAGVAYYPLDSGSAAAVTNQVLDVAELLAAYIRDGTRP